ncbi:MAG: transglycosylase SLT domain-containing protein [Chloroflexi bacterium]|nr:transglycosylase SLT domain-containing protein [Chloroflexota bacterium]
MKRYQVVIGALTTTALVVVAVAAWLRLGPGSRPAADPLAGAEVAAQATTSTAPADATPSPSASMHPTASVTADPAPTGPASSPAPSSGLALLGGEPAPRQWGEASRALADGDYAAAIPLLEAALNGASQAQGPLLRVALGRALYESDRFREAAEILAPVDAATLPEKPAVEALGLLARACEASGDWIGAITAYDRLLGYESMPADVARFQAARVYLAMGDAAAAAAQLGAIDLTPLRASRQAEILEELAEARAALHDEAGAADAYAQILSFAENYAYRAQVLGKQADALRRAERRDDAVALYQRLVAEFADTSSAGPALAALDELGVAGDVSDFQRGVVLYGSGKYGEALQALRRYLEAGTGPGLDRAQYYVALALQRLEQHAEAIAELDALIAGYPDSALLADAWMAKARSLSATGGDVAAFYEAFADAYPQSATAPRALWLAAEGLERQRDWDRAAHYYSLMHTRYPADSGAPEARFREALMAYAGRNYRRAQEAWQAELANASGDGRTRLLVWLGLASRHLNDEAAAASYWREAAQQSPQAYYGLRARDLLDGDDLLLSATAGGAVADSLTSEEDWEEIEAWVAGWAGAAALEASVADRPLVRHSQVMWTLNWHAEAVELLRLVRPEVQDDAGAVLSLLHITVESGITPFSIWGAERLAALGASAGAGDPPAALLRLAYPTNYGHLVSAEAHRLAVDPFLFLGLVRQESRFDPHSESWAGALGLTQVIPSTGADIAAAIGPADYRHDMLRRPVLSVRYGVWYLSRLLEICHRDWIAAISSYNGGYGNVTRWAGGEIPIADHDLFYELVTYAETKSYIRLVYENYRQYQAIYR